MASMPHISMDVADVDPLAALRRGAGGRGRRVASLAVAGALAGAAVLVAPHLARTFGDALGRAVSADPRWAVAGVAFELASFAGYIALFWHVAGRAAPRIGLRASSEISLAGAAATRLLPTAGAGGAALTYWSLRRAGQGGSAAARTLLTFLVVLYSVFLAAIAVAGGLLVSGAVHTAAPAELGLVPGALAAIAIVVALGLAWLHRRGALHGRPAPAVALGGAVSDALTLVRRPDPRLAGAAAWWGFDLLVLWAMFSAFGGPPPALLLVLGYFLGQVANTVPLPGAASGGMTAAFLAFGTPAALVIPAVLAYRAIAIWTPVPVGAVAIGGLRRTARAWAGEPAA
jgi:uncharacterized membrane protein YbhN (UPF0104 family)